MPKKNPWPDRPPQEVYYEKAQILKERFRREYLNEVPRGSMPVLIITPNEVVLGIHGGAEQHYSDRAYPHRQDRSEMLTLRVYVERHFSSRDLVYQGMGDMTGLTSSRVAQNALYRLARTLPKTMFDYVARLNEPNGLHNLSGIARGFRDWWYR